MRLLPEELALANLKGEIPDDERGFASKEEGYEWLKELSGEDFGYDIEAWSKWVDSQSAGLPSKEEAG